MARLITRGLISLLFMVAAGASAGLAGVAAQEPGALVNGVSVCPPNLEGAAINAADCTEPAANVGFYVANPNTGNVAFGDTGGDGLVSFPLDQFAISPDGAEVEVGVIVGSDPYGAITGYAVGCTRNGEGMDLQYLNSEIQPGGATLAVRFTAFGGDQVACEWYLSHAGDDGSSDDGGDTGDSGDQSTGGPITDLPSTGTGGSESGGRAAGTLAGAALVALVGAVALRRSARPAGTARR